MTPKMRQTLHQEVKSALKELRLSTCMAELCAKEATPGQEEFLLYVLREEKKARERKKRQHYMERAGFPTYKTLQEYTYEKVTFPPAFSKEEMVTCNFIREHKNLVLYGPVGTGKTHLAIGLGLRACMQGLKVRFFVVTELVLRLAEARQKGTLERLTQTLAKQDLLILDEWGYVPVERDGSQLLFRIVADSYEKRSLILTTNLEFSRWGSIFTDEQMAAAMIDRLAHHGHLLLFQGRSYRMEHALMREDVAGKAS